MAVRALLATLMMLGVMCTHSASAQHTSVAMPEALEKMLRVIHRSKCGAPVSVGIEQVDRDWVVTPEWDQQTEKPKWVLGIDTGEVAQGPCPSAKRPVPVRRLLAFVRAFRAATKKSRLWPGHAEHLRVIVERTSDGRFWVEFSPTDRNTFGGGEAAWVDGSFHVIACKFTQ
jgi:hypothetical protein